MLATPVDIDFSVVCGHLFSRSVRLISIMLFNLFFAQNSFNLSTGAVPALGGYQRWCWFCSNLRLYDDLASIDTNFHSIHFLSGTDFCVFQHQEVC